eukprot:6196121-Pleurochrysis_carterae.AAC.2
MRDDEPDASSAAADLQFEIGGQIRSLVHSLRASHHDAESTKSVRVALCEASRAQAQLAAQCALHACSVATDAAAVADLQLQSERAKSAERRAEHLAHLELLRSDLLQAEMERDCVSRFEAKWRATSACVIAELRVADSERADEAQRARVAASAAAQMAAAAKERARRAEAAAEGAFGRFDALAAALDESERRCAQLTLVARACGAEGARRLSELGQIAGDMTEMRTSSSLLLDSQKAEARAGPKSKRWAEGCSLVTLGDAALCACASNCPRSCSGEAS